MTPQEYKGQEVIADSQMSSLNNHAKCWLCLNSNNEHARKLHTFMLQNVSTIGVESMIDMVHKDLQAFGPDEEGTSRPHVRDHIQGRHLLCPSLQIAQILRNLIDIKDTLHKMLIHEDENGCMVADAKNMAVYLKVITEIMHVYNSKLLNATEDKQQ